MFFYFLRYFWELFPLAAYTSYSGTKRTPLQVFLGTFSQKVQLNNFSNCFLFSPAFAFTNASMLIVFPFSEASRK